MKKTILIAIPLCLVAALAFAADMGGISGTVTKVDTAKKIITFQKGDEELVLKSPNEKIMFVETKGTVDNLVDGKEANVSGKVNEDQTAIASSDMILYPGKGRGSNRFLRDTRADGKLKQKDNKWYVVVQGKDVLIEMKPNYRVTLRDNATLDQVEVGDRIQMYAMVENGEAKKPSYISIHKKAK